MLDYLNGNDNEIGKPNENYARTHGIIYHGEKTMAIPKTMLLK